MIRLTVEISRYVLLLLMLLFTISTYKALRAKEPEKRASATRGQLVFMVLFNFAAYGVIFIQNTDVYVLLMYAGMIAYVLLTYLIYRVFYKGASFVLVNTMCMMISIGLVIHTRLDISTALKQLIIAAAATVISFVIPIIIRKVRAFSRWGFLFAVIGILLLAAVFVLARVTGGGKLSIEFHGITFQFSEFVKITFVFFVAAMLNRATDFRQVFKVTVLAGIHVVILVASTDLGAALVFFVAYMVMVCVATRKVGYAFLGFGGMAAASVAAYKLFAHVRVRVDVWRDPFADYQGTGYQIVQALFSVVAGGWFGTGLLKGSPDMIPLVQQDFTFAAICEELGILFAICLILLCMGMYLIIVNLSMKLSSEFYRLIAIGLGTEYAFQVFLTIGGTTKLIPMTGITLPLVSYGGSSLSCTIFMLAIIQGLYILRKDEYEEGEYPEDEYTEEDGIPYEEEAVFEEPKSTGAHRTGAEALRGTGRVRETGATYAPGEETKELEERIWKETENSLNR